MFQKGFTQFIVLGLAALVIMTPFCVSTVTGSIFGSHAREGTPAECEGNACQAGQSGITGGGGGGGGVGACTFSEVKKDPSGTNLVNISVPIWKYVSSSNKTSATMSLRVHRNCATSIENIFKQIYENPNKLPIDTSDTGCYSRRSLATSRHNWGVACDINWNENWCSYCYCKSGNVGNFWKPGNISPDRDYKGWVAGFDPRSIAINGEIAKAFAAQNWGRGLYNCFNDYMHFSVDGH
jgi:hypothetical protein